MKMTRRFNIIITSLLLAITVIVTVWSGKIFVDFAQYDTLFDSSNATSIQKFSDYSPKLKGTVGDSDIYVFDSGVEGPSILIIGGTHPNEPASQLTATLLLENINVTKGKVYIITEANRSAFTYTYPLEATSMYYSLTTSTGVSRLFKYGTRATNTNQQWPNPDIYVHATSGQKLSSADTRNLNRAYPGSENGTYTEKVAYAITQCIIQNEITLTIDLHEASPEYITINAIVYHQRAAKIAAKAQLAMDFDDVEITLNESPTNLHGLSHRELGDYTKTLALLCETSNASQGKIRGAFTADLITSGNDKFYNLIADYDKKNGTSILYAPPVDISVRVARHTLSVISIINAYNSAYGSNTTSDDTIYGEGLLGELLVSNVPSYDDIVANGVGYYLSDTVVTE